MSIALSASTDSTSRFAVNTSSEYQSRVPELLHAPGVTLLSAKANSGSTPTQLPGSVNENIEIDPR